MNSKQKVEKERYIHLDIVKCILIFSFILAHFFPYSLTEVYWNTGGFVLMSGYITGILLPRRPLSFTYGTVKFLKINLWVFVFFLLDYTYHLIWKADSAVNTLDMSVLEYIALFYLIVPLLGLTKYKRLVSSIVILIIIFINYIVFNINISSNSTIPHIINILFIGDKYGYPLLSFVNIGILGFLYGLVENTIPFRKLVMTLVVVVCSSIYWLDKVAVISIWTDRNPPLFFYIIFSLAVFSLLLDGSRVLSKLTLNPFVKKIITNNAKYSIIIFVIHRPAIVLMDKLINIHALMIGKYLPDLVISIVIIAILNIVLCYAIDNTIGRLPNRIIKTLL